MRSEAKKQVANERKRAHIIHTLGEHISAFGVACGAPDPKQSDFLSVLCLDDDPSKACVTQNIALFVHIYFYL